MAKKLTESTRPSALLLLSEYRRMVRATQRLVRSNPIVAVACVSIGMAVWLLSVEAGKMAAMLLATEPNGLTATSLLLLLFGSFLGAVASSASPRAADLDEQFQTVPASRRAAIVCLNVVPVLAILTVAACLSSLFMFGVYAGTVPGHPAGLAARFGFWVLAVGAFGAAWAAAMRIGRYGPLYGGIMLGVIALAGWPGALGHTAPWWASLAAFLPGGPGSSRASLMVPDPASLVAAGTVLAGSITAWLWFEGKESPRRTDRRHQPSVTLRGPSTVAIAMWLAITLVRSRPYSRLLYAPCVGVIAGVMIRVGFTDATGTIGPLIATGVLLALMEPPLHMSVAFGRGSWLLRSCATSPSAVAAGWWIAATLVACIIGIAGLAPALMIVDASRIPEPLALVPVAAFAIAAAGRMVPWTHESAAMQFVSSVAAALCVTAVAAFQIWAIGRFGPLAGLALAIPAVGLVSYLICLSIETERQK